MSCINVLTCNVTYVCNVMLCYAMLCYVMYVCMYVLLNIYILFNYIYIHIRTHTHIYINIIIVYYQRKLGSNTSVLRTNLVRLDIVKGGVCVCLLHHITIHHKRIIGYDTGWCET